MTAALVVLVIVLALVSSVEAVLLVQRNPQTYLVEQLIELLGLTTLRSALRYEVLLSDWAEDATSEEMRWRWVIRDADRILRAVIADEDGSTVYMLGNAPTRAMAEAEALAWIATQDATSFVVQS